MTFVFRDYAFLNSFDMRSLQLQHQSLTTFYSILEQQVTIKLTNKQEYYNYSTHIIEELLC